MSTIEEFNDLADHLQELFKLHGARLHEHIYSLYAPNPGKIKDVVRLIFHAETASIGLSFHIETAPTDAVQVFERAKLFNPNVNLFTPYFVDRAGNLFVGQDASLMSEQAKQHEFAEQAAKLAQAKQAEEWEMKQLSKGKITFH